MTDNEIIKGLECCVKDGYPYGCEDCPYHNHDCNEQLNADALSLINRQKAEIENYSHNNRNMTKDIHTLQKALEQAKAEIERLEAENENLKSYVSIEFVGEVLKTNHKERIKAEAIKEFVERLKAEMLKSKYVPTADVVEVRHGEWLPDYEIFVNEPFDTYIDRVQTGWKCSLCGRVECAKEPYCHCGAKMDGKDEGE